MTQWVTLANGITLQYVERGSTTGVPVVFLHGVTDSWRSFEPVLERLPAAVRAFAVTQRGHGLSSKPYEAYGYADMAEDLRGFMDAIELPSAIIVGHSMGSLVAQRFVINDPQRVAGLVLIGGFRTIYRHPGLTEFWDTAVSELRDPIDPGFVRDFQLSTLARKVPTDFLNSVVVESLHVPARVWRATFRHFLWTPDFSSGLTRYGGPALIAWGDRDAFASREDQEGLRRLISDSRLVTYAGAGHAVHWEDPARFADDLLEFVFERSMKLIA
jgi:non-heme chloroperoxidase